MPSLICNASAGEEYRSVFKPAAIIGSGGFGTVWLYRKESGPAVIDEVCLKVITHDAREEAAVIAKINGMNRHFVGLHDVGCSTINARVLQLRPDGEESFILMRRATGSLDDLKNKLKLAEALEVTAAMAKEVLNTYTTYGLYNLDIKPANFQYSITDDDTVDVCVSDLGSLRPPGAVRDVFTIDYSAGYIDLQRVTEDYVVYQLTVTMTALLKALPNATVGETFGDTPNAADGIDMFRKAALSIVSADEGANNAFKAALAYGLQCDLNGVLLPNAGLLHTQISKFMEALGSTGDPQATLVRLRGPIRNESSLDRIHVIVQAVRENGRHEKLSDALIRYPLKDLLAYAAMHDIQVPKKPKDRVVNRIISATI